MQKKMPRNAVRTTRESGMQRMGRCSLQCKACHWIQGVYPGQGKLKEEWNRTNQGWESSAEKKPPNRKCRTQHIQLYTVVTILQANSLQAEKKITKYCLKCGQKFDWEEKGERQNL
ncbi:MAG: hypothetical protein ACLTER_12555 [Ruminococcus sp.]